MPGWGEKVVASCLRAAALKFSQHVQNTHFMNLFISPVGSGQLEISGFRPNAEMAENAKDAIGLLRILPGSC